MAGTERHVSETLGGTVVSHRTDLRLVLMHVQAIRHIGDESHDELGVVETNRRSVEHYL